MSAMYVSDGFWHAVDSMHEPSVTKTLGASLARSRRAVPEPEVRRAALVRVIREPLAVRRPERIRATNHARSFMGTQEVGGLLRRQLLALSLGIAPRRLTEESRILSA